MLRRGRAGRRTDSHGRVNAFTPHSDVLLCHPSRESISVSSRLAARHQERQAFAREDERVREREKLRDREEDGRIEHKRGRK